MNVIAILQEYPWVPDHCEMKDITDTVNDVCMVRQCNVLHDALTVAMLPKVYNYIRAVSHVVGYCLYGTLLLCPCWTVCPVQIRAHHHIDVHTDTNDWVKHVICHKIPQRFCTMKVPYFYKYHYLRYTTLTLT